ncbi:MAG: bacterioferritin [Paracoccaceae bacterium]
MKGPEVSLKHIQRAITMELTTINTYLLQERQLEDWGIDRLAKRMREETDEERGHASMFIERMLFLEGTPDVQTLDPIDTPESIRGIFDTQYKLEREAVQYYSKAAVEAQQAGDVGTFDLFMRVLRDEEEHVDFIEDQYDLMEMMGQQLYIARQVSSMGGDSDEEG